jgi:predicted transposase/invertase (TIGR01784 family)
MVETLNPRLDVVFKLLMADPSNRELLLSLLNAVLQPARPIVSADVVNPEIQKDGADDRGLVLDILSVHDDGTRSDVEMQIDNRGATEKRALYHWARVYRDGLGRGDDYSDLHPCRVVFILAFRLVPGSRIHSTFRLQEVHDATVFSNDLEIHTLELTKVGDAIRRRRQRTTGRGFWPRRRTKRGRKWPRKTPTSTMRTRHWAG